MMSRSFSLGPTIVAVAVLTVSCVGEARPSFAEWETRWDAVVATIPAESDLGVPPDEDACGATLAAIRTVSGDLTPSPDPVTDRAVREWIEVAEMMFFECPPEGNEIDSMAKAYDELERLEAEVQAVRVLDEGS